MKELAGWLGSSVRASPQPGVTVTTMSPEATRERPAYEACRHEWIILHDSAPPSAGDRHPTARSEPVRSRNQPRDRAAAAGRNRPPRGIAQLEILGHAQQM